MTYILILFLTYVLHLLLKLNWVCTAVVLVFLLVMQHFHRIKGQRFQEARKRFLDVSLYIDTLLYSFLKEQKIIRAFEDVKSTLADGHMKETVSRAIDHMMLTFDETEVFVDAMRIIEDEYKCNRIVNAHEFMAHAEYYGGDIKESARILLKDKSAWERRILRNIEDRQRMFHQIIRSLHGRKADAAYQIFIASRLCNCLTNYSGGRNFLKWIILELICCRRMISMPKSLRNTRHTIRQRSFVRQFLWLLYRR